MPFWIVILGIGALFFWILSKDDIPKFSDLDVTDVATKYSSIVNSYLKYYPNCTAPLMLAIILCESSGDNLAQGSAGERGAMQIKQIALDDFNDSFLKNYSLFDLSSMYFGVEVGMGYFSLMVSRTSNRGQAIRSYHSGVNNSEDLAGYYYEKKVEAAEVLMKGKVF